MSKVLIIEDEKEIANLEKDYLEIAKIDVDILNDCNNVDTQILEKNYDLILLDLMLPSRNGLEICKELRNKTDIPIMMVTAKGQSIDKIRGLGIGAGDYISKPFDPAELVARVQANLNQYNRLKTTQSTLTNIIRIKNIEINIANWKVYKNEKEIKFTSKEFELLKFLAENPNRVFTKEEIFEKIWGYEYIGDVATVTVHINRIREKIEEKPPEPEIIETIWGVGYRLTK